MSWRPTHHSGRIGEPQLTPHSEIRSMGYGRDCFARTVWATLTQWLSRWFAGLVRSCAASVHKRGYSTTHHLS